MKSSHRNLLAAALATALMSPAAWAQEGVGADKGPQTLPTQNTPTQVPPPNVPERTMREIERTSNEAVQDLPPAPPPQSQGAEHAADHSAIVQRDVWTRLDTDGDGRISTSEGAVDTAFEASFSTYDADGDGFVTEAEFRAGAKAEREP